MARTKNTCRRNPSASPRNVEVIREGTGSNDNRMMWPILTIEDGPNFAFEEPNGTVEQEGIEYPAVAYKHPDEPGRVLCVFPGVYNLPVENVTLHCSSNLKPYQGQ